MFARPLSWAEWILWCLREEPRRIFDEAECAASVERFLASQAHVRGGRLETAGEVRERLDAHYWRQARSS